MNKRFLHKRVIIACTLILLDAARAMRPRNICAFFKARRVFFISIQLYKPRFRVCRFTAENTILMIDQ